MMNLNQLIFAGIELTIEGGMQVAFWSAIEQTWKGRSAMQRIHTKALFSKLERPIFRSKKSRIR